MRVRRYFRSILCGLKVLMTLMTLAACNKAASKLASDAQLAGSAFQFLRFSAISGTDQVVSPKQPLPEPLQFRVTDDLGQPIPGVLIKTCLIDVTGYDDGSLLGPELVAACQAEETKLASTSPLDTANSTNIPSLGKLGPADLVGQVTDAQVRSNQQGLISLNVTAPNFFDRKIAVIVTVDTKAPASPMAFTTFQTSLFGAAERFVLERAESADLIAGSNFDLFISVRDREGYQVRNYDGKSDFTLTYDIPSSWAGLAAVLPNKRFTCVFTGGRCLIPGGPFTLMAAGKATITMQDHAHADITSSLDINVVKGPETAVIITDNIGGDAAGAVPLTKITLAPTEKHRVAAAVVDRGGNFLRDGTDYAWAMTNDDLAAALPSVKTASFVFMSKASGEGQLTAKGNLGTSAPVTVEVTPGPHAKWLITTEHGANEGAGECFAVSVTAVDENDNTSVSVEGPWQLELDFGGVTESGPPVKDTAHWTSSDGSFGRHTIISSVFSSGMTTLPVRACFYDASNVSPTIRVSSQYKPNPAVTIRGELSVNVHLSAPDAIDLSTKPFGDPDATSPCAGTLGDDPSRPCIDFNVDESNGRMYVLIVDKGGNPLLSGTPSYWMADGPLAPLLNGKEITDYASLSAKTVGTGTIQVSAGAGFRLKKPYRVRPGAPASFTIASGNGNQEIATRPFAVRLTAYDQFGNLADTYNGSRAFSFTLEGAETSPAPARVIPVAAFEETVSFEKGEALTTGTVLQPRSTYLPGLPEVKPVIQARSQGQLFTSEPINVAPGVAKNAALYSLPGGFGVPITAPIGLRRDATLVVNVASLDANSNFVRDELSSFTANVVCTIAARGCPYDPLSARSGIATTLVPSQTGTGTLTATPVDTSVAPYTLAPIHINASNAESLRITTTNSLKEPAGIPFHITVTARDRDGNIADTFSGDKTLNFVATTSLSWTGQASILPNGNIVCSFVGGVCVLSDANGPIDFVVNDSRQVHLLSVNDVGTEIPDIWGSSITALKGDPAQVLITTESGNAAAVAPVFTAPQLPEAVAMSLPETYTATADDDPFELFAVLIDAGGNFLSDAPPSTTWSASSPAIDGSLSPKIGSRSTFTPGKTGSSSITVTAGDVSGSTPVVSVYHGIPSKMDLDTEHHLSEVAGEPFRFTFTLYDRFDNQLSDLNALVKLESFQWKDSFVAPPAFGPGTIFCVSDCSHRERQGQGVNTEYNYFTISGGKYTGGPFKGVLYDAAVTASRLVMTIGSCIPTDPADPYNCTTPLVSPDGNPWRARMFPYGPITSFTVSSNQTVSVSRGPVSRVRLYSVANDFTSEVCDSAQLAPTYSSVSDFPTAVSKALTGERPGNPICMRLAADSPPHHLYPRYSDAGGNDFGPTFGNWSLKPRSLTTWIWSELTDKGGSITHVVPDTTALTTADLSAIAADLSNTSASSHAVITPRRGTMRRFTTVADNYTPEPVILEFTDLGPSHIDAMLAYTVGAGTPTTFQVAAAGLPVATDPIQLALLLQDAHQNSGHVDEMTYDIGLKKFVPVPLQFMLSTAWHGGVAPPTTSNGVAPVLPESSLCNFLGGALEVKPQLHSSQPPSPPGNCQSSIPLIPVAQTPTAVDVTLAGLGTKTAIITTVPGAAKGVQILKSTEVGAEPYQPDLTFSSDETVNFYGGAWDAYNNYAGPVAVTANATGSISDKLTPTIPSSTVTLGAGSLVGTSTLSFTQGSNTIDLGTVTITPGVLDHFSIITEHAGTETAGHAFKLTIEARDKANNLRTQFTGDIDLNWLVTGDATTAEGWSARLPADGPVHFEAGVSTTTITTTLYNAAKSPTITVSTLPGGAGVIGQAKLITVQPDVPDHYGVDVTSGTTYIPKSDLSTKMSLAVSLRDAWGNQVSGGEAGVALTMAYASDGSSALGDLNGPVTDIDLSSGYATVDNVAWGRPGRYQIRAKKPSGGVFDTPVGPGTVASDTIQAQVTLAAIKSYKLTIASAATAGQPQGVQISALDVAGQIIADPIVTTLLAPLTFTWSGASPAPDGTLPVFPGHPSFVQGTASLETVTFQKAETIPAGGLVISDSQSPPVTGASTNAVTVSAGPIDHYKITSSHASRMADDSATGQFSLTVSCYDNRGNPRNGDTVLTLLPVRIGGPATLSTIQKIGSTSGTNPVFNMAATSSITLSNLYYLVPQTLSFTLSGASGNGNPTSDQVAFVVSSATVKSYSLSLSTASPVAAGANNVTATVAALDVAGNVVSDLDSALDTLTFNWSGSAVATSPAPAATPPTLPSSLTFTNGLATTSLSLFSAGTGNIKVKDNYPAGERSSDAPSLTVTPASPAKLAMSVAGSTNGVPNSTAAVAGVPFDIQVDARDAYDNLVNTTPSPSGTLTFAWVNASASLANAASPTVLPSGSRSFGGAGNHPGSFLSSDVTPGAFALYNASDTGVVLRLISPPWPAADLAFTVSPNPLPGILKIQAAASKSSTVLSGTTVATSADATPSTYYAHSYDAWGNYLQREKVDWSGSGALGIGSCNGCNISPTTGVDLTTVTPGVTGTGTLTATLTSPVNLASSVNLSVSPGAPASLQVTASASTVTAGQDVGIAVTILDKNGNVCTQIDSPQTLYWAISDGSANTEGRSADLGGSSFPVSGSYAFTGGVMTSTVTARLYNSLANAPLITASTGPNGTKAAGSTSAFTVNPGSAHHYGIAANGAPSSGTTPYSPRADYGTLMTAVVQLRDAYGNRVASGGESGVSLTMYDVNNSTNAIGTLRGTITGLDLTTGEATVTDLAWSRGGIYQLRAAKPSGGLYTTPVGVGTAASTTITSTATLATVASYGIAYSTPMTAGTGSPVTVYALDTASVAVTGIDTQLTALQFSWSGPHNAPNGQPPVYPTTLTFSGGVAISFWTLYNAETISTAALSMHDNQASPVYGAPVIGSSALVVSPSGTIDHYGVTASTLTTTADGNGTFNLTVTCYDPYSNPRKGENGIYLDYARVSGVPTLGLLSYGGSNYQASTQALGFSQFPLNMAAVSSTTIGPFTFTSPQTIDFSITMSSVDPTTTVSDQVAFTPTAGTIYQYALTSSSTVTSGPNNAIVSVYAQDRVGNTLTTLDSVLNGRTYTRHYTTSPANPICNSTFTSTDPAPDGISDFSLGPVGTFAGGVASMTASVYKTGTKGICIKDSGNPQISGGTSFTVNAATNTHFVMKLGTYDGSSFTPLTSGTSGGLTSYTLTAGTQYAVSIEARDIYENQDINYSGWINGGSTNVLQWVGASGAPDGSSPYTTALGATSGSPTAPSSPSCFHNPLTFCPANGLNQGMALVDGLFVYNASDSSVRLRLGNPALTTADLAITVAADPNPAQAGIKTLVQAGSVQSSTAYPTAYPTVAADVSNFNLFAHRYDRFGNWIGLQTVDWSGSGKLAGNDSNNNKIVSPTASSSFTTINLYQSGTGALTAKSPGTSDVLANVAFTISGGAPVKYAVALASGNSVTANGSFAIRITAQDSKGNPASSYTPSGNLTFTLLSASSTAAQPTSCSNVTPAPSTPTFTDSVATVSGFKLVNTADTNVKIRVVGDLTSGTSAVIPIDPGTPAGLWLSVNGGSTVTAGDTGFDSTIRIVDGCSNPVTDYGTTASLNFTLSGSGSSLENATAPVVPANGSVIIPASTGLVSTTGGDFKVYKRTGTNYDGTVTLSASCTIASGCPANYTSNSVTLTVNPGSLHHMYLQNTSANYPRPSSKLSGTLSNLAANSGASVTYYAWGYDFYGNAISTITSPTITWATDAVTNALLSASSGPSTTLTPKAYAGGSPASTGIETITATCSSCTPTSATVSQPIVPGTAAKFTITAPSTVMANDPFSATVQATDFFANPVSTYSGAKSLTLTLPGNSGSTPAAPTSCSVVIPSGSVTFPASGSNSVVTISGFKVPRNGDVFTVTASASGMASSSSNTVTVNSAGSAAKLWMTIGGSGSSYTATAGTGFDVTVNAVDACSNLQTAGAGTLNFTLTGAGTSLENATPPVNPANGATSITGGTVTTTGGSFVLYKRTGTNYDGTVTLQATCNSCAYTASNSVTLPVNPGALHHFYLQSTGASYPLPSAALSGTQSPLTANSTVTYYAWAYDYYGNALNAQPTATWSTGGLTNATKSTASGTAMVLTPGSYSVSPPSLGNETITASLAGATPSSVTITQPITYGPLSSFNLTPSGGTAVTAGSGFDITVTARDVKGNTVASTTSYPLTWSWNGTNTTSPAPSNTPPTLDTNTTRTFTNGVYASTGAPFKIYSASASGAFVKVTSGTPQGQTSTLTVSPGNAASLSVTATPSPTAGVASSGYQLKLLDSWSNLSTSGCGTTTMTASCASCTSSGLYGGTATSPVYTGSPWSPSAGVYTPNVTLYKAGANTLTFSACGFSADATPTVAANTTVNNIHLATGASDPGQPASGAGATTLGCTSGNKVSCQNVYAYAFDAYGNSISQGTWSCPSWTAVNADTAPFTTATYVPSLSASSGHSVTTSAAYSYHMNDYVKCTSGGVSAQVLAGPTLVTSRPYSISAYSSWTCSGGNPVSTATLTNSSGYDLSGVTFSGQNAGNTVTGCSSTVTGVGSSGTCTITVTGTAGTASGTITPSGAITTANSQNTFATLANPAGATVQSNVAAPNCSTYLSIASSGWSCIGPGQARMTLTVTNPNTLLAAAGITNAFVTQAGATQISTTCSNVTLNTGASNSCSFVIEQTTPGSITSVKAHSTTGYFASTDATYTTPAAPTCP